MKTYRPKIKLYYYSDDSTWRFESSVLHAMCLRSNLKLVINQSVSIKALLGTLQSSSSDLFDDRVCCYLCSSIRSDSLRNDLRLLIEWMQLDNNNSTVDSIHIKTKLKSNDFKEYKDIQCIYNGKRTLDINDAEFIDWIVDRSKSTLDRPLSMIQARQLMLRANGDLSNLWNALQLLRLDAPDGPSDGGSVATDAFGLADAALSGDASTALTRFRALADQGEDPVALIPALAYKFRQALGSPNAARARSCLRLLQHADLRLKSGRSQNLALMERLLVRLCGARR